MERKREPPHEQEAITWKVSEGNECGGSPEQKEQRKPTRNRNHSMKAKKSERDPAKRAEEGGDEQAKEEQKAIGGRKSKETAQEYSWKGRKEERKQKRNHRSQEHT